MQNRKFKKLIVCLFLFWFLGGVHWVYGKEEKTLVVSQVVVGYDEILGGKKQIIEIKVKNLTNQNISAIGKLKITLPNKRVSTYGKKKVKFYAKTETSFFMTYPVKKNRGGKYTVRAALYRLQGKRIRGTELPTEQVAIFHVPGSNSTVRRTVKRLPIKKQVKKKSALPTEIAPVIQFDPSDLVWLENQIMVPYVLRGGGSHVRLALSNQGGDVARNVFYRVFWYLEKRPNYQVKIGEGTISFLAPGEKKVFELPVTIPDDEPKGIYKVVAKVDEDNRVRESDEENNEKMSINALHFNDIALKFPEDDFSFAESGLFHFTLTSTKYNLFKIQISADRKFSKSDMFEVPQGEGPSGWTGKKTIQTLKGELPGLGLALMKTANTDYLYWRVRGSDSDGKESTSEIRKFYINRNPTQ